MRTTIDAPASVLDLKRPPTHPGEMLLEEFLRPAGLTQVEAARRMGVPLNRLNEIIRGKRGVTADTALRLAKLLKTSAEFWLGLRAVLLTGGLLACPPEPRRRRVRGAILLR